ncbi:sarcosine oxidase subunit delta family protein [Phyllobacterium salinisoli]|uniref:Sarcosine oxidase subunit delta family protein n=1 Tax=Phyllobacterium salinisoli TaxID=1899321 RepID=A0A368K5Z9_9HYPH|nr:sarcosine oxidase subunit delta [Phyllobacterium salinisoli]RCS23893.1 sarcosine oxidase subunit delta family protein [Phyllobacterium salinisoli]
MLLIYCPYCEEERPEIEFRHAGQAHLVRSPDIADQGELEFEAYLYLRQNPKGIIAERWRHIHGCGRFFNAIRDTVSDRIYATYKAGELMPDLDAVLANAPNVAHSGKPLTQPAASAATSALAARKSEA